jgi:hypothetical protein
MTKLVLVLVISNILQSYFSNFDFEVHDIFEIEREGERDLFKPWEENSNRVLLWHGYPNA